jgi:hypothetical protein
MEGVVIGALAFQAPSIFTRHGAEGVGHISDGHWDTRDGRVLCTKDMVLITHQTFFILPVELFAIEGGWVFVLVAKMVIIGSVIDNLSVGDLGVTLVAFIIRGIDDRETVGNEVVFSSDTCWDLHTLGPVSGCGGCGNENVT